ncbi:MULTISPECIES: DUF732 domain-containing protein [Mycobacterium]|uniref:DUF732 domain-containing protein n=1 Tax=Mycobacterium kiyosense TaxID=2871094 RepID=A0A9P3UVR8_9MYCO|nr:MULTISPECIES: DUF732 domain-containing protein [Mycobacterium]BDB42593.1 hypothetical protein IWGMT90018_30390 [Mycobacterium kiyosense]BDE14147.1 hypothetical protein MKCMC460_30070 [Mycobacterium sp. 20KCMC460]GLB82980.1 hypothetical protein SRL2020028_22360 [Mycobacterium kiyosense]GLB89179.1 hypothetical protein SRL2020130_19960 [Mycobacterium kiyosense]GLB93830.1 hypothetical protein SRL2020226_06060 [Mycobacterium kiyosense]
MRKLLAVIATCVMIGSAAPAEGEPGDESITNDTPATDDAGFLAALRTADIGYSSPAQVITSAKAVCTCLDNGESGFELIHDVKTRNPGFTLDAAAEFAVISAKYYCPHQLSKA